MIGKSATTAGAASILAGGIAFGAAWLARPFATIRGVGGLIPAIVGATAFGVAYLALCRLFGNEEQAEIVGGVRRRLRRR
jgi:hypothetical protein